MTVYFFVSDDDGTVLTRPVVKIGYSDGNTPRRVYDVGTGCPFKLKLHAMLPGDKEREEAIQESFAQHRIRKEWFWWVSEIEEWIAVQDQESPPLVFEDPHKCGACGHLWYDGNVCPACKAAT